MMIFPSVLFAAASVCAQSQDSDKSSSFDYEQYVDGVGGFVSKNDDDTIPCVGKTDDIDFIPCEFDCVQDGDKEECKKWLDGKADLIDNEWCQKNCVPGHLEPNSDSN
jgi:hypothetical protein